ncbi:uncharacterized protein LOC118734997 [Rhagoletis pomonella]|uniref:uncharacterized protein LOC118734997 n=1 Tax=Rhagoletis pomonella TaxID=28610 RepID=UPI00177C1E47|nr:uncharacterized protein LOC118734997 [Rhagoletis pomonella]
MQTVSEIKAKTKRVRCNPTRKWAVAEEKALVEFLLANRDLERPTAEMYYTRFVMEYNVAVEWKAVRSKVRYMRSTYNKAKGWEGSTGAGSMDGETIKSVLLKKCTFFYELEEIFGHRLVESAVIEESLESLLNSDNAYSPEAGLDETATSLITENLPEIITENEPVASTSRKGIYSRTAVSDILQFQSELVQLKKHKIDQDMILREKEIQIRERELVLKEREIELKEKQELILKDKEMEMKLTELNSQEKIKIMELEMKERLAMEEFKRKYK